MAEINDLNITDASNTARFPENMPPSDVNNSARALEGILARFYKDLNGSVASTGSANTYVLAANQTLSAYYDGLILTFDANFANTGAAKLNVDSLGEVTIKKLNDQDLASGDIEVGMKVTVIYDGTNFQMMNPVANALDSAGGLANIVEDLAPQLGGTLDTNSQQIRWSKGADVTAAATLTLGTDGNVFDIDDSGGPTTITSIATLAVGTTVVLHFDNAGTILTHHATDLVLGNAAANITTAAGDIAIFYEYATGDWRMLSYSRADGSSVGVTGKKTQFIPAAAMRPTATNGCANLAVVETTAGRPDIGFLAFDGGATEEHAQFSFVFPASWDESTISYRAIWSTTNTSTNTVSWGLQAVAITDGDPIDVAFGTAIGISDAAQTAANDILRTDESAALTVAGSPVAGDMVYFDIFRDTDASLAGSTGDDMTQDARLLGVELYYTVNSGNDA